MVSIVAISFWKKAHHNVEALAIPAAAIPAAECALVYLVVFH